MDVLIHRYAEAAQELGAVGVSSLHEVDPREGVSYERVVQGFGSDATGSAQFESWLSNVAEAVRTGRRRATELRELLTKHNISQGFTEPAPVELQRQHHERKTLDSIARSFEAGDGPGFVKWIAMVETWARCRKTENVPATVPAGAAFAAAQDALLSRYV